MTVRLIRETPGQYGPIATYSGLSGDTKPTSGIAAGSEFIEQDTGGRYLYDGDSWSQTATSGAAHVHLPSSIAGERNTSSGTNSYLVARDEANLSVISKTTAVTIGGGAANDTHLFGVLITAALTGSCVITGFADSDGAARSITLPPATPAGDLNFRGAINSAGALTFTCSNAADNGLVSVLWMPR